MKKILLPAICFSMIITSCTDKNLAEPKTEIDTEELYTTREFEVDGTTYLDYINSKGEVKFTMGGDLHSNSNNRK